MTFTTISAWAHLIARALDAHGVDPRHAFRNVGLDPDLMGRPGARYPTARLSRLWAEAANLTGNRCFGLDAARYWHPTVWHALGYSWFASDTLEAALQRLVRYSRVLTTAASFRLTRDGGVVSLEPMLHPGAPNPHPVILQAAFACIVRMCRTSWGEEFAPLGICYRHEDRGCEQRLRAFFGAPIEYGAPADAVLFDREVLREPLPSANADLAEANDQVAAAYLRRFDGQSTVAQVRGRLVEMLSSGEMSEESVAAALCMSPRSLQRKLRAEGTTFRQVVEDTRRELAETYLSDPDMSLGEIAFLLGFAEPSVFSRAFRRWRGVTPSQFRGHAQAG